jgi:putative drug exporter of the RND superfamily
MSSSLYRLGRLMARRAKLVLVVWLVAFVGASLLAAGAGGELQDDLTIPGTESQAGIDVLERQFPEAAGTSGQVLFVAPDDVRDHQREIRAVLARVEAVDHVVLASDPFGKQERDLALSGDGRHALSQVQLDIPLEELDERTLEALTEAAGSVPDGSELQVDLGGSIFTETTVHLSITEVLGVVVALVVLAVTFGSLLAAGMPILTAVVGVGVAMAGILTAAAVTGISSSTPTLALMIGLAVGIDYALFIVSRHRGQLVSGMDVEESIARSSATAGSAVIFAGATVVIALSGLVVARIPFLAVMGFAAAAAVAVAVLVALSVVPALLAVAGERLRPRPGSRAAKHAVVEAGETHTLGARWVGLVTRVPALTVALVVVGLAVVALPAKDLALALPDNGTAPPGSTERVTYDKVTQAYGAGHNAPLLVTVDIIRSRDPLGVMDGLADDIERIEGVEAVALSTPNRKADLGIVQIIPETAQSDPATAELVREIRSRADELEQKYDVEDLLVTGHTAVAIDVSDRLGGALLPFGVVVVGLSLLLLTVVFRSIAVPVKATLGYLLSVAASFGAVAAVFEWGWLADELNVSRVGPVISFMPIILMGVLFGLAMDYEVFLVSRMREEYVHFGDAKRAIHKGFTSSARVVTAAAVIMISVFAAFVPNSDAAVKPIAFGLAVGVFVDAFLVRMTLVPAVLALLGDRAWRLPGRLDRRLPVLDVEGAGLEHHLDHEAWTRTHGTAAVRAEDARLVDEHGSPVFAHVDTVVRPGELLVVRTDDRIARRALLAALAGRLDVTGGRLVVLDRVLPDESAAVRTRVHLFERFPRVERLSRVGRRRSEEPQLVVVDDVDVFTSDDELVRRWELLATLTARGVTVVAGTSREPLGLASPAWKTLTLPADGVPRPAATEANL